jgi:hypothetical protein
LAIRILLLLFVSGFVFWFYFLIGFLGFDLLSSKRRCRPEAKEQSGNQKTRKSENQTATAERGLPTNVADSRGDGVTRSSFTCHGVSRDRPPKIAANPR